MVGLRAKVLGQMGWTTSPYQRACALSCPSPAIYGPGSLGHLTRPFALPRPDALSPLLNRPVFAAHNTRGDMSIPSPATLVLSGRPDALIPRARARWPTVKTLFIATIQRLFGIRGHSFVHAQ